MGWLSLLGRHGLSFSVRDVVGSFPPSCPARAPTALWGGSLCGALHWRVQCHSSNGRGGVSLHALTVQGSWCSILSLKTGAGGVLLWGEQAGGRRDALLSTESVGNSMVQRWALWTPSITRWGRIIAWSLAEPWEETTLLPGPVIKPDANTRLNFHSAHHP